MNTYRVPDCAALGPVPEEGVPPPDITAQMHLHVLALVQFDATAQPVVFSPASNDCLRSGGCVAVGVGAFVVGALVEGAADGALVVGALVVGAFVVGVAVGVGVGAFIVGAVEGAADGALVVGALVVGAFVVGIVLGLLLVGIPVGALLGAVVGARVGAFGRLPYRKVSSLVLLHSIIPQTGAVALMRVPACSCVLVLPCASLNLYTPFCVPVSVYVELPTVTFAAWFDAKATNSACTGRAVWVKK